jgi:hypothetical protein
LWDEPRLIRPPREEYLLASAFFRLRHDACDRLLDLDIIDEAEAALEQARGNVPIWKVEFGGVSLLSCYGRAILLCGDLVSPASRRTWARYGRFLRPRWDLSDGSS